jgi:FixJ family two-component response regulator
MRDGTAVVVVVDDDKAILRAVARMLDTERLRVFTFSSAQEFLDESRMPHPDCLLLDIRMPDFDGLDLIRVVRATRGETPAVFMTATGRVATVVEAMREGAEDLLVKPFTAAELMHAIEHALESGGATRVAAAPSIDAARGRSLRARVLRTPQQARRRRHRDDGKNRQSAPRSGDA